MNGLIIGIGGFWLGTLFLLGLRSLSLRSKVLQRDGIPLVGGIAIALSFTCLALISLFFFTGIPSGILGILAASLLMLVFGIADDFLELSVAAKFIVQVIAVSLLVAFGVKTRIVYIGDALNLAVTFLWVIGITNAFNLLDILDGLAAFTALLISAGFFIIAWLGMDAYTMILSLSLAVSLGGFLVYNLPPAQGDMGNAGSHFLGFVLAALAVFISYAPLQRPVALFAPVIILGLPIIDTAFLIVVRLLKKNLPFKKSNDHPALKLLALGFSKGKALFALSLLCLFFVACGVLVSKAPNVFGIAIAALAALVGVWFGITIARVKTV
ncbi:MAG: MraY family glycosyltransferase [Candidatus Omnitrophica bacterium]|nr:MraY family glycosyltransferase [Candidatus Omnitrophota bacterium]